MSETVIHVRATRQQMRAVVRQLPALFAGHAPESNDLAYGFSLRLGTTCMSFLRDAFITKARGGTDEAGEKWRPLSPYTICKRLEKANKTSKGRKAIIKKAEDRVRSAKNDRDRLDARRQLDKIREVYGNAKSVEILRDTGRMFNSISPGIHGELKPSGELQIRPGEAICGTNVEYAAKHQEGDDHCPQRRLWPEPAKWPAQWWEQISNAASTGVVEVARLFVARLFGGIR